MSTFCSPSSDHHHLHSDSSLIPISRHLLLPKDLLRLICIYLGLPSLSQLPILNRTSYTVIRDMHSLAFGWQRTRQLRGPTAVKENHLRSMCVSPLAIKHVNRVHTNFQGALQMEELALVSSSLPCLRSLQIALFDKASAEWSFPSGLRELSLQVRINPILKPPISLVSLATERLPSLEVLTLVTHQDCSILPLHSHPCLRSFSFSPQNWDLSPETVKVIQSWPSLMYLSIYSGRIESGALHVLTQPPSLPRLNELDLSHTYVAEEHLGAALARFPALTKLRPSDLWGPAPTFLRALPALVDLSIRLEPRFPILAFDRVFEGMHLLRLSLHIYHEDLSVSPPQLVAALATCDLLQSLELRYQGISAYDFGRLLSVLPHLTRCRLKNYWSPQTMKQVMDCTFARRAQAAGDVPHTTTNLPSCLDDDSQPGPVSHLTDLEVEDALYFDHDLITLFLRVPHLTTLTLTGLPFVSTLRRCMPNAPFTRALRTLSLECEFLNDTTDLLQSLQPLSHLTSLSLPSACVDPSARIVWDPLSRCRGCAT